MTHTCSICGGPIDASGPETHHDNEQRGDNRRENLRQVHRRCHMNHHDNRESVDRRTTEKYGPRQPRTGPPTPSLHEGP